MDIIAGILVLVSVIFATNENKKYLDSGAETIRQGYVIAVYDEEETFMDGPVRTMLVRGLTTDGRIANRIVEYNEEVKIGDYVSIQNPQKTVIDDFIAPLKKGSKR